MDQRTHVMSEHINRRIRDETMYRYSLFPIQSVVQVWDASSGNILHTYTGHTDGVYTVAWSPDGKRLASSSDDTTVQVWDASRLK